ncbi:MAG: hypothetical protein CSB48_00695 [Proteobacteria bacterium]|nr:MAG: hypothetical protein CSB48_00695 [Pseudomonadota bacterium]
MRSIKKVAITFVTTLALSGVTTVFAENATTVSSDGFLELTVREAPAAAQPAKKVVKRVKKAKPTPVRKKRAKRKVRAKHVERKKRVQRAKTYRVRSGDTLTKISRKTGVSLSRLVRLNGLRGSKKHHIEVGQRLRLR